MFFFQLAMLNSVSVGHQDLAHQYQLAFMNWHRAQVVDDKKITTNTWITTSTEAAAPNMNKLILDMSKLRDDTPSIYVKGVVKQDQPQANCDFR